MDWECLRIFSEENNEYYVVWI